MAGRAPPPPGPKLDSRPAWTLAAVVLGLVGWWMLLHDFLGGAGYVVIGIGVGIFCGVLGSFARDLLAGSRERF